jgi:hypothetical protein
MLFLLITATILTPIFLASSQTDSISNKAINYLENSCNPILHLIPETNNSKTYWMVSDNLLACYALRNYNQTMSSEINETLKAFSACYSLPLDSRGTVISYRHEALIGEVLPNQFYTSQNYSLLNSTYYSIYTEVDNGTLMTDWKDYADLLALRGISNYNQGSINESGDCYNLMMAKWDGKGFADIVFDKTSVYSTYKLGLAIILSNKLGISNSSVNDQMFRIIDACQVKEGNYSGGVRTDYTAHGTVITPQGQANTETTSIVAIANPRTISSMPEFPATLAIAVLIMAVTATALVFLRRKLTGLNSSYCNRWQSQIYSLIWQKAQVLIERVANLGNA